MTQLTDPSRYLGQTVTFLDDEDRFVPASVLSVGSGGVLIDGPGGSRLVVPAELHRLHVPLLTP